MTTPFPKVNSQQAAENSILDFYFKQVYLGNSFVLSAAGVALSDTVEHNQFLILNPATSNKSLFFYINRQGGSLPFYTKMYYNPTITGNGTPATPVNMRPAYSTSSVASCFTAPTTSASGTSLGVTVSSGAEVESRKLIVIDPGYNLLMTVQAVAVTAMTAFLEAVWYEI